MNNCTGYCHETGTGGMQFTDESGTYAAVMAGAATEAVCGLTDRIVAGDAEKSILWWRIRPVQAEDSCLDATEGDIALFGKMPFMRDPLSAEDAQLIYDWIQGGAKP